MYDLLFFVIATLLVGMIDIMEGMAIDYLLPLQCRDLSANTYGNDGR